MKDPEFFVVWNFNKCPPTFRHSTQKEAEAEAERLAEVNHRDSFFVLRAVSVSRKVSVMTTYLSGDPDEFDPPF